MPGVSSSGGPGGGFWAPWVPAWSGPALLLGGPLTDSPEAQGLGAGAFPGSGTRGAEEGQPGPRRPAAHQAQPVFGEVAESKFQEAITLVETSFLWPGLVTWLVGTNVRQGHGLGQLTPPRLLPETREGGAGRLEGGHRPPPHPRRPHGWLHPNRPAELAHQGPEALG